MENCNKIEKMVIDGTITTDIAYELSTELQDHIKNCDNCKRFVDDVTKAMHALSGVKKLTVSDDFDQQLQIKLAHHRKHTSITKQNNVSIFTRMTYYVAGIAAVLLGFIYISNMGIIDNKGISLDQKINVADKMEDSSIINEDSLKNLQESVINDEELRNRVSTDEDQ
ncbi:MAG: hypothetical protein JXR69_02010 [Candidatus Delongbacteria bacterium]|nr:hypothetical protein [Candidatus Delongbacteria bacterium]